MIGKHIEKSQDESSFRALNSYITGKSTRKPEDKDEKIAYSDCLNLFSVETATDEMEALAFTNNRCKDPVMHLLLSWRENENPTKEQVREAVEITLGELNLGVGFERAVDGQFRIHRFINAFTSHHRKPKYEGFRLTRRELLMANKSIFELLYAGICGRKRLTIGSEKYNLRAC